MKKILILIILNTLWFSVGSSNEPKLGMATFGFSCDPILGKAKERSYIGFIKEENLLFELSVDKETNEFFFFNDTPLFFESINDKDNSFENIYIWYELFVINGKVAPLLSHQIFYFDKNKNKYFYSETIMKYENKKIFKIAKNKAKIQEMSFTDELNMKVLKKMQNGFSKENKSLFKMFSPAYGDPLSTNKLIEFGKNKQRNLYVCQKI
tara:strand:- start:150 stop:776 length:627 start_codon:yes stop_codon:yes gene_type:complete